MKIEFGQDGTVTVKMDWDAESVTPGFAFCNDCGSMRESQVYHGVNIRGDMATSVEIVPCDCGEDE